MISLRSFKILLRLSVRSAHELNIILIYPIDPDCFQHVRDGRGDPSSDIRAILTGYEYDLIPDHPQSLSRDSSGLKIGRLRTGSVPTEFQYMCDLKELEYDLIPDHPRYPRDFNFKYPQGYHKNIVGRVKSASLWYSVKKLGVSSYLAQRCTM